ncbi:MAG: YceI family protein [Ignavibacteriaceae bacterium]|nr:YceI family protein [Ignavibacteriaceae bacterium]NUM72176.1 YceI family protein [Ignavibacteriaceae bacterium]
MSQSWNFDNAHSEIQFKVKHLMITNVTGTFGSYKGSVSTDGDDFSTAKVSFEVDVNSVNTGIEQRDAHLRSADFFEAEKFPVMKFESTKMEKVDAENYKLHGKLTIKETTKDVVLNVEYGGLVVDPYGNMKAGFTLTGKLNRKEYGLMWNAVTEAGGVVVSDEVRLYADVQIVKG